jgi:hypothetical protein
MRGYLFASGAYWVEANVMDWTGLFECVCHVGFINQMMPIEVMQAHFWEGR